jgi:hypothetical protein
VNDSGVDGVDEVLLGTPTARSSKPSPSNHPRSESIERVPGFGVISATPVVS